MLLLTSTTLSKMQHNTDFIQFSEKAQCLPITYINYGGSIAEGCHLWIELKGVVNGVIFNNAIIEWKNRNTRRDVKGELDQLVNSVCTAIKQHIQNECQTGGFYSASLHVDEFIINITPTWNHHGGQVCKLK